MSNSNNSMTDNTTSGINRLIEIFNNRIEKIVGNSLKRFICTYKEHPDFKDEKIPFTKSNLEKAETANDDIEKIVFVLGAGTSKSAGLPLAKEIIEYCRVALGEKTLRKEIRALREDPDKRKDADHSRWISELTGHKHSSYTFEEVLSVYKKVFGPEEAIILLKEHFHIKEEDFPKKTLITLFNECLAHLAREHLVDFIITFNFDELLEHSINEDIGSNAYVKIQNQASFKWADTHGLFNASNRSHSHPDQRPSDRGSDRAKLWLLKPHGTISQENTLRHLIEEVGQFEIEKADVLKKVLKNAHIVVVGYSLSAIDLHKILITHALSGSIKGLYWVDQNDLDNNLGRNLKSTIEKVNPGCFYHIKYYADDFILNLFEQLYSKENIEKNEDIKKAGLLPPFRHFARAFIFQIENGIECTFENRFILEVIIYSIRMKGWFSSRTIDKCQQINHLINSATHAQRESIKNLPDKLKPFFINFPRKGRAEKLFILRKKFITNFDSNKKDGQTQKYNKLFELLPYCIPKEIGGKDPTSYSLNNSGVANISVKFGSEVLSHQDVSPYSNYGDFTTFDKILIIPNKAVLVALTEWLFSKNHGLYAVSESGEFIKSHPDAQDILSKFSEIAIGDYLRESFTIREELLKAWVFDLIQSYYKSGQIAEFKAQLKIALNIFNIDSDVLEFNDFALDADDLFKKLLVDVKTKSQKNISYKYKKSKKALQDAVKDEKKYLDALNEYFCLKDINNSLNCIKTISEYRNNGDENNVNLIATYRKRFHLHLWENDRKVFGILFNRVDRQARTVYNWIKLDLNNPHEEAQFKAFLEYISSNKSQKNEDIHNKSH